MLLFVSLITSFAAIFLLRDQAAFALITVPGVLLVLVGLTSAVDLNGAARATARSVAEARPLGVDCSRSFMATPRYARLMGIAYVLIGVFWCALGLGVVE